MSIFEDNKAYKPFKYPWAAEAAQDHSVAMYWDVHQIELQDDLRQYNQDGGLKTKNVSHETNKHIIDSVLCLFTEMDRKVGEGYTKIIPHIHNNEVRNMLLTFAAREVTHQRAYALLAETFGFSDSSWLEFSQYKEMVDKIDAMDINQSDSNFGVACNLAQLLLSEGIGLFAAFAVLLNFKRQGLLMGFNDVNQWSLADEQEHVENNIKALNEIRKELTEIENGVLDTFIRRVAGKLKEAEISFIDLVFKIGDAEDLTSDQLKDYIEYLEALRLYELDIIPLRDVPENPLKWMNWLLAADRHDNFFEKRVVDYDHSGLVGTIDYSRYK